MEVYNLIKYVLLLSYINSELIDAISPATFKSSFNKYIINNTAAKYKDQSLHLEDLHMANTSKAR
jgi:hypothetical protein